MAIELNGTTGITTPDITSTAGFDSADLTGDIAAARITTALNATGSAPIYACRAWVNFNGTGTVAIRASGNVSSITDNGTGSYTVNFTTAMPDTSYATNVTSAVISSAARNFSAGITETDTYSTTAVKVAVEDSNGVASDMPKICVSIFR